MTSEQEQRLLAAIRALKAKAERYVMATEGLTNGDLAKAKMWLWAGPGMEKEIRELNEAMKEL